MNVERAALRPCSSAVRQPRNSTSSGCLTPDAASATLPFIWKPSAKATASGNSARGREPISCSWRKVAFVAGWRGPHAALPNHGQAHPSCDVHCWSHAVLLAVLDRLALLPGAASSEGLVEVVPFINQAWFANLVAFIGMMLMRGPKYRESEFAEVQQSRRAKVDENRNAFIHAHRSSSNAGHSASLEARRGPCGPVRAPWSGRPARTARGQGASVAMRSGPCDGETHAIPERWPRRTSFEECLSSLVRDDAPEVQIGLEGWDVPQGTRDGRFQVVQG